MISTSICKSRFYLLSVILFGCLIRSAHLLSDHYYVLSIDSYYFQHLAKGIANGVPVPASSSGIAYPLGYLSEVFGIHAASVILPLIISIAVSLLIYAIASRYYGRSVGLCSALAWQVLPQSYFITATGYLDRDGLNVLLISLGAFLFLLSNDTKLRLGPVDIGWLILGIAIVGIGQIVTFEWAWIGRWLLLAIIAAMFMGMLIGNYTIRRAPWAVIIIVFAGSLLLELLAENSSSHLQDAVSMSGQSKWDVPIGETRRVHVVDIMLWYHPVLLMIAGLGVYSIVRRYSRGHSGTDLALLGWAIALVMLAFGAKRCLVPALPAISIIIGIGLAPVLNIVAQLFRELRYSRMFVALAFVALLVLVGGFFWNAYYQGTIDRITPGPKWQRALDYVKSETPIGSRVLCFGDYGYLVMDLGERSPVARGSPGSAIELVSRAYCADSANELADAIHMADANYFIYSRQEFESRIFDELVKVYSPRVDPQLIKEQSYARRILEGERIEGDYLDIVFDNEKVIVLKPKYTSKPAEYPLGQAQSCFP